MTQKRPRSDHRHIIKRIVVCGKLVLQTPTSIGNGDADATTDLPLLRDSISQKALVTGSSIAGALRNYLHEYEFGYGASENTKTKSLATKLFGFERAGDSQDGEQSPLIVDDTISSKLPVEELRDGVEIESETGIAADNAKYDLELLAAGTEFPLRFELLIEESLPNADKQELVKYLGLALRGFERCEIGIGMKKRRGFGRCQVLEWQVWQFDLTKHEDRLAWLTLDRDWAEPYSTPPRIHNSIADALDVSLKQPDTPSDSRQRFCLKATFQLASPLLIRSGHHLPDKAANVEHLRSYRNGEWKPVISGTSLAGVLRHRAERIVATLGKHSQIVKDLFGFVEKEDKEAQASKLVVHENVITDYDDLVQSRIGIDRFTGGPYQGALFNEQVLYGKKHKTHLVLELELRQPKKAEIGSQKAEIGLLLLLLKDLWTEDLPIGGASSIGRGRLRGVHAEMTWHNGSENPPSWSIFQKEKQLEVSDISALEAFVEAFVGNVEENGK